MGRIPNPYVHVVQVYLTKVYWAYLRAVCEYLPNDAEEDVPKAHCFCQGFLGGGAIEASPHYVKNQVGYLPSWGVTVNCNSQRLGRSQTVDCGNPTICTAWT